MKLFLSIFTRSNITLALSLFGAIGTSLTWIHNYLQTRKNFSVEIIACDLSTEGLLLYIRITNNSSLPLSINEIELSIGTKSYICEKYPLKVIEQTHKRGKTVLSHHEYFSMAFPINLQPFCGESGYLYFSSEKDDFPQLSTPLTLIIRTNRGREVQKTLELKDQLD